MFRLVLDKFVNPQVEGFSTYEEVEKQYTTNPLFHQIVDKCVNIGGIPISDMSILLKLIQELQEENLKLLSQISLPKFRK